ncbi:hypothetical protein [Agromyces sp. NBRC 114283]|uniref:hypothetical protein n=1 Tax=Agromyces sp. NBRC 114283 TaxID=2994521 RepID=UPI0024A53C3E|nr:hypothetical protein [Agromyces sp. NBRC 114283]GLU88745.1 hypothetical protein Agsp01_10000 [Agromyces sp. NBRC 114283]
MPTAPTALRLLGAASLVAFATLLSACSAAPGGDGAAENGGALENSTFEQQYDDWRLKYDACMKKAGVELPKPAEAGDDSGDGEAMTLDAGTIDFDAFQAADEDCRGEVGDPPVDPDAPTAQELYEQQLVFAKCMREAGYDYADPEPPSENGMSAMAMRGASDFDEADLDRCSEVAGFGSGE